MATVQLGEIEDTGTDRNKILTVLSEREEPHTVTYRGFLQIVRRTFPTRERAEQWARQVGQYRTATIEPTATVKPIPRYWED